MDVVWADMLMDVAGVWLTGVISEVLLSRMVMKSEQALSFIVEKPEVSHLH